MTDIYAGEMGFDSVEDLTMEEKHLLGSFITDYDTAKHFLFMKVRQAEWLSQDSESYPHKDVDDLRITYHISVGKSGESFASAWVTDRLLETFGITVEQLHADAVESGKILFPPLLMPMSEVLKELLGESEDAELPDSPLLILTNKKKMFGASVMFYPGVLEKTAKIVGGGFYILPSSIHEVIIYPENVQEDLSIAMMEQIVYEINREQVLPKERLSDHVYHYNAELEQLERGMK